jgi:hypothetical protein
LLSDPFYCETASVIYRIIWFMPKFADFSEDWIALIF